ncbi:hypothetical protein, partial [Kitasatospora nipponensis]
MGGTYEVVSQLASVGYDLIPRDAYAKPRITLEVTATQSRFTEHDLEAIGNGASGGAYLPPGEILGLSMQVAQGDVLAPVYYGEDAGWALRDLLSITRSTSHQLDHLIFNEDKIMVPIFGSPPSDWKPLRSALNSAQHAALIPPGWEMSTGHPQQGWIMVAFYVGGQIFVRVIQPGLSATGDGVSAWIRR